MIAAMCELYLASREKRYLQAARRADGFLRERLFDCGRLHVSYREGTLGAAGFLDDYAGYAFAQLALYRAALEPVYLKRAADICDRVLLEFGDGTDGFYLYGKDSEKLILHPKETYDGAMPSGNSLMAYVLVRLSLLTEEDVYQDAADRLLDFLAADASSYPPGYGMFLTALLESADPPMKVTVVPDNRTERDRLALMVPPRALVLLQPPNETYPLKDGRTTYYVCQGRSCRPPVNDPHTIG